MTSQKGAGVLVVSERWSTILYIQRCLSDKFGPVVGVDPYKGLCSIGNGYYAIVVDGESGHFDGVEFVRVIKGYIAIPCVLLMHGANHDDPVPKDIIRLNRMFIMRTSSLQHRTFSEDLCAALGGFFSEQS